MVQCSQYVAGIDILSEYNATYIHSTESNIPSQGKPVLSTTNNVNGISINGWYIRTSSSKIANHREINEMTSFLQRVSNNNNSQGSSSKIRRLCIPDIVFINAIVSVKYLPTSSHTNKYTELKFDAREALCEWAECHSHLSHYPSDKASSSYRGVSVLRSKDAKLWERRLKESENQSNNFSNHSCFDFIGKDTSVKANNACSPEFYYDWTFSTPYTGTILYKNINKLAIWTEINTSKINLSLLMDRKLPILYFDHIRLYEDDLHDNGYTSLSCKIRVMPTYFYILLSLFVRVDYVTIRLREVRIFYQFDDLGMIYRDISWKECPWNELESYGLPTQVSFWRSESDDYMPDGNRQKTLKKKGVENILHRLPKVKLPDYLPRYSYCKIPLVL